MDLLEAVTYDVVVAEFNGEEAPASWALET